jgi:hypothetical protein
MADANQRYDQKEILNEIESFYASLYQERRVLQDIVNLHELLDNHSTPKLNSKKVRKTGRQTYSY